MNRYKLFSISLLLLFFAKISHAQFIKGIGFTIGGTLCNQVWNYKDSSQVDKKRYRIGLNGSIFLEMIDNDYWRWISEIQYNQKGAVERLPSGEKFKNGIDYISFNNFIKLREEEYTITPYLIAGPRIEYRFATYSGIYPEIINNFSPLHVSFSAGAGVEFISHDPFIWFVEFQYNPDITNAYRDKANYDLRIRHRAYELRVGFKYAFYYRERCP